MKLENPGALTRKLI